MTTSLYDHAGGGPALLALADAHHTRCLADPMLEHPFSHTTNHPEHVARLAAYWAEALGGPDDFSRGLGSQQAVVDMHCVEEDLTEMGRRFVACFVAAMDDAGLPDDAPFRAAMAAYMRWAVAQFTVPGVERPATDGVPRWTWDGLAAG